MWGRCDLRIDQPRALRRFETLNAHAHKVGAVFIATPEGELPAVLAEFRVVGDLKIDMRIFGQRIVDFRMIEDVLREFRSQFALFSGEIVWIKHFQ